MVRLQPLLIDGALPAARLVRRGSVRFKLYNATRFIRSGPHIPMLKEDNVRQGFFEDAQVEAAIAQLPDALQPVVRLAAIMGWRMPSEVMTLQWHQVDLDGVLSASQQTRGLLRLEPGATKNRQGRVFPCTPELRDLLLAQRRQADEHRKAHGEIVPWVFHIDGEPITRGGAFRWRGGAPAWQLAALAAYPTTCVGQPCATTSALACLTWWPCGCPGTRRARCSTATTS